MELNEIVNVFKEFEFVTDCTIKADGEKYKVKIWTTKTPYNLDYVCYNMHEVRRLLNGNKIRKDIRESIIFENNEWLKSELKKRWGIGEVPDHLKDFYDQIGNGYIQKSLRVTPKLP